MDNQKSRHQLEQEIIKLKDLLEIEKRKKAEKLFAHRLVFAAIIFVIILLILCVKLEYASSGVQWVWLILLFGAGFVVLGLICRSYSREEDEARK